MHRYNLPRLHVMATSWSCVHAEVSLWEGQLSRAPSFPRQLTLRMLIGVPSGALAAGGSLEEKMAFWMS